MGHLHLFMGTRSNFIWLLALDARDGVKLYNNFDWHVGSTNDTIGFI